MNDFTQKPVLFFLSILAVLACSLFTWSMLHGWKPFISGEDTRGRQGSTIRRGSGKEGRVRNFSGSRAMLMSGENRRMKEDVSSDTGTNNDNVLDNE